MVKTWQESFQKLHPNSKMVRSPSWSLGVRAESLRLEQVLMASLWNECSVDERGLTMRRLGQLLRVIICGTSMNLSRVIRRIQSLLEDQTMLSS